jgi:predicted DNA-binding transcriptional regulator YafY
MLETSTRLLRLLGLLQTRRDWTSAELATRLNVTTRTIRNDMARRVWLFSSECHAASSRPCW